MGMSNSRHPEYQCAQPVELIMAAQRTSIDSVTIMAIVLKPKPWCHTNLTHYLMCKLGSTMGHSLKLGYSIKDYKAPLTSK